MAYGAYVAKPYMAGGNPTDALSAMDLGRAIIAGLTPMVQEVTHEITGMQTLAPVIVTVAGTRIRVSGSSLLVRRALIQALPTNINTVTVGDANVVASMGTQGSPTARGHRLNSPGVDFISFDFNDLTNVWVDAASSGDGVTVVYWT